MGKRDDIGDARRASRAPTTLQIANLHHIGARENQQDSFGVSDLAQSVDKGVLVVVADGMGGLAGGAEVSAIVTSTMLETFRVLDTVENAPEALLRMAADASSEVLGYLRRGDGAASGSTLVAAHLRGSALHFLSVGDSRICLLRNGGLLTLNREHTYGRQLDERAARGELSLEEARSDPQRAALTSYIGAGELEMIDRTTREITLLPGDCLLLMTDGVFGTLRDEEIIGALDHKDLYKAAKRLEEAVLAKRSPIQDNFTAVIVKLGGK